MENEKSHPKNQHYVPELLLKNFFSKESYIWVYDKEKKKKNWSFIKERPISRVASEDYFYDKIKNVKESSYEYELVKIETEIAPIIKKIIQNKNLTRLTNFERNRFSFFIATQFLRTKYEQNKVKDSLINLIENLALHSNLPKKNLPELDYKSLWLSNLEDATEYTFFFSNKVWFLGESDKLFISSDNPVVKQNLLKSKPYTSNIGLDSYGIEIYLPLNDSLILCMYCEKHLRSKFLNKTINKPILFTTKQIFSVNSLQLEQSERFVFSSRNNFEILDKYKNVKPHKFVAMAWAWLKNKKSR